MIKLLDLLKEIKLGEAIVKVPQEILSKSKDTFNYINWFIKYNLDYIVNSLTNGGVAADETHILQIVKEVC